MIATARTLKLYAVGLAILIAIVGPPLALCILTARDVRAQGAAIDVALATSRKQYEAVHQLRLEVERRDSEIREQIARAKQSLSGAHTEVSR